jgi:hypothetical protein
MATPHVESLKQFVAEIGGNQTSMLNHNLPNLNKTPEFMMNYLNNPNHRRKHEHHTNQLKKQFGGDTRARLKAKLAANSP